MTEVIRTVTVLGASGNLGPHLLTSLRDAGFTVSVVTRLSSKTTFPSDVAIHRSEYSTSSLQAIFKGQDAVISTIASLNDTDQTTIIDAAIAAGVKRFVPSQYGGDTELPGIENFIPFAKGKKDIVAFLKSKESKTFSWTALFTGPFFDWVLDVGQGLMGWEIENQKATIFDSGDARFDCTNIGTVAKAITSALTHFEATRNQQVYINSFQLTQNQVVAALERLSDKKLEIRRASSTELAAIGAEHTAKGDWEKGFVESVTASMYAPWGFVDFGGRPTRWNAVLELPKDDLDETLRQVLRNKALI